MSTRTHHMTASEPERMQICPTGLTSDFGNEVSWWRFMHDTFGMPAVIERLLPGLPTYQEKYPPEKYPELYTKETLPRIEQLNSILRAVCGAAVDGTLTDDSLARASDSFMATIYGDSSRGGWHPVLEATKSIGTALKLTPELISMLKVGSPRTVEFSSEVKSEFHELLLEAARHISTPKEQGGSEAGEILGRFGRNAESLVQQLLSIREDLTVAYSRILLLKTTASELLYASTQLRHFIGNKTGKLHTPRTETVLKRFDPELQKRMLALYGTKEKIFMEDVVALHKLCTHLTRGFLSIVADCDHKSATKQFACEHFLKRFLRFHGTLSAVNMKANMTNLDWAVLRLSAKETAEAFGTARSCFENLPRT